jgi:hypothetical protein
MAAWERTSPPFSNTRLARKKSRRSTDTARRRNRSESADFVVPGKNPHAEQILASAFWFFHA